MQVDVGGCWRGTQDETEPMYEKYNPYRRASYKQITVVAVPLSKTLSMPLEINILRWEFGNPAASSWNPWIAGTGTQ